MRSLRSAVRGSAHERPAADLPVRSVLAALRSPVRDVHPGGTLPGNRLSTCSLMLSDRYDEAIAESTALAK